MSPKKANFQERGWGGCILGSLKTVPTMKTLILQQFRHLHTQVNCNLTTKAPVAMTTQVAGWTKFPTPHQGAPKGLYGVCWCAGGVTWCPSTPKLAWYGVSSGTAVCEAKLSLRLRSLFQLAVITDLYDACQKYFFKFIYKVYFSWKSQFFLKF